MIRNLILFMLYSGLLSLAQNGLQAPDTAAAGSEIVVTWSISGDDKDFITIVPEGTAEGTYKHYCYARKDQWKVMLPEQPGTYEIRYLAAKAPYETLHRRTITLTPVTARLEVPSTVAAGSNIDIIWEGPGHNRDFITIVPADAAEKTYKKYVYARKNPAKLKVPDQPGSYEVRYLTGQSYLTLDRATIDVTAVSATLEAVAAVDAGAPLDVSWTGPDNQGDYITIVPAESPPGTYKKYKYTKSGNPVQLRAPDVAGAYEVRYLTGGKGLTLASIPVNVGKVEASLSVPESVEAGSVFPITWRGPENAGDYLTVVKEGAPEKSYDRYVYARKGSPVDFTAPEVAGTYEVRYVTGQKGLTLGSTSLKVTPVHASLKAPDSVIAGEEVSVTWRGPDNPGDFIACAPAGSPSGTWPSYGYTRGSQPAVFRAPLIPGDYELRYHTGRKHFILATRPIVVEPAPLAPGLLKVVRAQSETVHTATGAIEVILDASGSMLQKMDGQRRIDIAKQVLTDLIRESLAPGTPIALRIFGHREVGSCRTDLEWPLAPLEADGMNRLIASIEAKNKAKTPIADALAMVPKDLASVSGTKTVVLITDGEETCGGDPVNTIASMNEQGFDVRVNIVGFAINDPALKKTFDSWANLGSGTYFDAENAEQLAHFVSNAVTAPFSVYDSEGQLVHEGIAGAEPVNLMPGTYSVKSMVAGSEVVNEVTVVSNETVTLNL